MPTGNGLLVFNPVAGGRDRRRAMTELVTRAKARGLHLKSLMTEGPGQAGSLVQNEITNDTAVIVVAGGDGTVGDVAKSLVNSLLPVAIYPTGTTNVLIREYGIGTGPAAEKTLFSDRTAGLSVWPAGNRVSLIGTGIAFDARVMAHTVPILKKLFGRTGIGYTATMEWLKYEFPPILISGQDSEGKPFERQVSFAVSANTRRYGGDPILSLTTDPSDALCDLVLFSGKTKLSLLSFYNRLSRGKARHLDMDCVERLTVREFTARSAAGYELEVQVDGDASGFTPVTVGPCLGFLKLVVPEA